MNVRTYILIVVILALSLSSLTAQESEQDSSVATARGLAAAKDYPAAIRVLREHLSLRPADQAASRLLARLYYWSGDVRSADSAFAGLLSRLPDDVATRIEFGRFLLETGQYQRAEAIIQPLASQGNADAETILGTSDYWQGDWTTAASRYKHVLSLQPYQQEARQRLFEIRSATAPVVSLSPEYQSDDQPIRRTGILLKGSLHITPLTPMTLTAGSSRIEAIDTVFAFRHLSMGLAHTFGKTGVTLEAEGGLSQLESGRTPAENYRGALSVRIPGSFTLSAYVMRTPYYETASSFSTSVTTTAWGLTLERSGQQTWIGKASVERKRYFDGNAGLQVYGWFLSSLGKSTGATLQVGYGFSFQDTNEDRYVLLSNGTAVYAPYYTPLEQITHSALLLLHVPFASLVTFTANGSYGVLASELAPAYSRSASMPGPGGSSTTKTFQRRSFSPWQFRASLDAVLSSALRLHVGVSRQENAYYQVSLVNAVLSYTFLPEADGR